jgi:hypothetical protein
MIAVSDLQFGFLQCGFTLDEVKYGDSTRNVYEDEAMKKIRLEECIYNDDLGGVPRSNSCTQRKRPIHCRCLCSCLILIDRKLCIQAATRPTTRAESACKHASTAGV